MQVAALLAGIACVGAAIYYFSRSDTADALYATIKSAAASGDVDELALAEDAIDEFSRRFPEDPRAAEVAAYHEQIDLDRAQRRLELRAHLRSRKTPPSAIEGHYLQAVRLAPDDPRRASEILAAVLALYGQETEACSKSDKQCLQLVEQQLEQLREQLQAVAEQGAEELRLRLQRADELRGTDLPLAKSMYQAIITLGGDHPWAASIVQQARERLDDASPRTAEAGL